MTRSHEGAASTNDRRPPTARAAFVGLLLASVFLGLVAWMPGGARPVVASEDLPEEPLSTPTGERPTPVPTPAGFHQARSERVTLLTDLPSDPELDQLPEWFEQAIPQWCEYFAVASERADSWRLRGFVVRSEDRFRQEGLWPDDLPDFLHGYQRGPQFWTREQPSAYYQRHLWLHEGTHAFMNQFLGTVGPAWLAEGLADYLATHRIRDDQLELAVFPHDKDQFPYWGRIRLLREAVAAGRPLTVDQVAALPPEAFQEVRGYAWSWALVTLLDQHPQTQDVFRRRVRALAERRSPKDSRWTRGLLAELRTVAPTLDDAWFIFLDQMDYGYVIAEDVVREQPVEPGKTRVEPAPLGSSSAVELSARQGWQATGWRVTKGQQYQLRASGRYRLQEGDPPWESEAGGVTIEYHRGRPRGELLASVRPLDASRRSLPWKSVPIGLGTEWTANLDGMLYLRVNERADRLSDNEGSLRVEILPAEPAGKGLERPGSSTR